MGVTIEWTVSVGTVIHMVVTTGTLLLGIMGLYYGVKGELRSIREWMDNAPTKEDFVQVKTRVDTLYTWWERYIERRNTRDG